MQSKVEVVPCLNQDILYLHMGFRRFLSPFKQRGVIRALWRQRAHFGRTIADHLRGEAK